MTTIRFLDSSSLIKLFVDEIASSSLSSYIEAFENTLDAFSVLAEVEVRSALHRRSRNRELTRGELRIALEDLEGLSPAWLSVGLDDRVIQLAAEVIARHALRSLDALQLASALSLRESLLSGEDLLFIAADKRLLAAASAEGLAIWNPETSAPPAPVPPVN